MIDLTWEQRERNAFIQRLQEFALHKKVRISFLSGDVHAAAVGEFKTLKVKGQAGVEPTNDYRYMLGITTSAIVNTVSLSLLYGRLKKHANILLTAVSLISNIP